MDPLQIPIMTLCKPFRVNRVEDFDNKEDPKTPLKINDPESTRHFCVEQTLINDLRAAHNILNKNDPSVPLFSVQVRCIQLNNKDHFIMNFPTFGHLFLNGGNH